MANDRKKVIDPRMPAVTLDLKGLITRSYHSGTDTHPVRDEETGVQVRSAAHGAANFMERILLPMLERGINPINIIAVNDGGNELRRAVFPGYKAKRAERQKEEPKEQQSQLKLLTEHINRILVYLGATTVKVPYREADDVIAAIVKGKGDRPMEVRSVDGDLAALISEENNTYFVQFDEPKDVYIHKFDRSVNGARVPDQIVVKPQHVTLFKSLIGDTSDEYPGVKGFGPTKWEELLDAVDEEGLDQLDQMVATGQFGDLADAVKANPSVKCLAMLLEQQNHWRLMYYVAQLHPEACWGATSKSLIKPEFTKRVPNRSGCERSLIELGCGDLMERLEQYFPTMTLADEHNLEQVFDHVNEHLSEGPVAGFDYESYDSLQHEPFREALKRSNADYVDVMSQVPTGASLCYGGNLQHCFYMPTVHKDTANVDPSYILAVLQECTDLDLPLAIQNVSFELAVTANTFGADHGTMQRPHDTRIMGAYVDENMMAEGNDGLKDMSWNLLRYKQTEFKELLERHDAEDMRGLTGEQTLVYGCDDSLTACHLWVLFRWILILEGQWEFFLQKHTAPAHVHDAGFRKGVNIDWDELDRLAAADAIVIEKGNARVRELLNEHCKEPNPEAARAFVEGDREYLEYSLSEKWKKKNDDQRPGKERLSALFEDVYMKALEGSVYTPYQEIKRDYDFIASAAQLRDVSFHLGFEPMLEKNTNKGINEWLLNWADTKLTENQREFTIRLGSAIGKPIKDRAGPAFEDLKEICAEVMAPHIKSDWVGDQLNFDSPIQMHHLLYCKLALPVRRYSKVQKDSVRYERGFQGSPATSKKALDAALAEDCDADDWRRECITSLREVKEAMTRFELFWTPYPLWKHPIDGAVHPGIKDPGTVTRRPTSTKPNILQVSKGPTRGMFIPHDDGRCGEVTKLGEGAAVVAKLAPDIFIPHLPKRLILSPDFSGQELRITGSEAQDPTLIKAYTGGRRYIDEFGIERLEITDIHSLTTVMFADKYVARQMGKGALEYLPLGSDGRIAYDWYQKFRGIKVKDNPEAAADMLVKDIDMDTLLRLHKSLSDCRGKAAKPTNFLITYLGTASTLAENTSMPEEFCKELMDAVFAAYARLAPWQAESIAFGKQFGYVTTAYGTRKHLSNDILSSDRGLRSREERRACNQKIQGCAADVLHEVETSIYETDWMGRYNANFLAPVYDEIDWDVPLNDDLPAAIAEMATMMDVTPPGHAIPMMAEFSFGPTWYNQEELGERPCERQIEIALSNLFKPKEAAHAA